MNEHRPITLEEISRLKGNDAARLERIRKKLGISQVFICDCIGVSASAYSTNIKNKGVIPKDWLEGITNTLAGIAFIKQGRKVLPVKNGKRSDKTTLHQDIKCFLTRVADPKVSVFTVIDRPKTWTNKLLNNFAEEAKILIEDMENDAT